MNIRKNSFKAWFLASRPKTLVASSIPVITGSALAFHDHTFRWAPALICLIFAIIAQIVSNFANDYFDFKQGCDRVDRQGPQRAVLEGWVDPQKMFWISIILLAIDCLLGLSLVYYGGWKLIGIGILVAVFALAYSGGPYPLSYHGWGDLCVLIFFGIVPVGFTYYLQSHQWTIATTCCGIAIGLVIVNILVSNNYRDRFTDKESEKNTTIVLFGERFGQYFYLFNGIVAVVACQYFWLEKSYLAAILPCFYLLFHFITWKEMVNIGQGEKLIPILEKTARNVLIFGILLSLGLVLS